MNGRKQHGIVGCASIDDYLTQVIKKHENTRKEKEEDRIRHVDTCNMHTGPIFLAYRQEDELKNIITATIEEDPIYDFTSSDEVSHTVWRIADADQVEHIQTAFGRISNLYIADGHHRCASAVKVGLKRRQARNDVSTPSQESCESDYFLSVLFPDEDLKILDYNRVIRDLNGYTPDELIEQISQNFTVKRSGNTPVQPNRKGMFGMFLKRAEGGVWYELVVKDEHCCEDAVKGLDVSILQECLLSPILGIADPKTDKRIDFVGGIRGLQELEKRVAQDMEVAFSLYPTSIEELFCVADQGLLMPPKSTWFEPKLLSGLFLHSME
jgi:uncharacterized protein (DUF1015 family)